MYLTNYAICVLTISISLLHSVELLAIPTPRAAEEALSCQTQVSTTYCESPNSNDEVLALHNGLRFFRRVLLKHMVSTQILVMFMIKLLYSIVHIVFGRIVYLLQIDN